MYHSSLGSNANFSSVCDYWQPAHSHSGLRAEVYERRDEICSINYTRYLYVYLGYNLNIIFRVRKEEAEGLIFMSTYLYVYLGYNLDIYI